MFFVTIDAMTPGAYRRGGVGLAIDYDYADTPFGQSVASTSLASVIWRLNPMQIPRWQL